MKIQSYRPQLEQEEEILAEQLASGAITPEEYNREMRELERDYRADAMEAAERAYDDELERW